MPSSRRRGPSGKIAATAARSAAIQAAEKRRREEQEHIATCMSNADNNNNSNSKIIGNDNENESCCDMNMTNEQNDYIYNNNTSTAKSVGNDDSINITNASTSTGTRTTSGNETGKKRKKFSLLPPFSGSNAPATTVATTTATINKSTASSSSSSIYGKSMMNHPLPNQPFCKFINEDSNRHPQRRQGRVSYKRKGEIVQGYADDYDDDDDEDDDDDDEGCLHCQQRVKNSPHIRVINDDDNSNNNEDIDTNRNGGNIQVRCDDCRRYICNGCHWCHEFQANHEIRVCDRCDAFYCRTCDEMDQCDDCGEVVCGSCSTLLSCKFCGGGLCEECATACGR